MPATPFGVISGSTAFSGVFCSGAEMCEQSEICELSELLPQGAVESLCAKGAMSGGSFFERGRD
jgi:hypothetical protein